MLPSTGLKRDVTATPRSPSCPTASRVHAEDAAVTGCGIRVGFRDSASGPDLGFYAACWYSLIGAPPGR
jgi:hypothetical protein